MNSFKLPKKKLQNLKVTVHQTAQHEVSRNVDIKGQEKSNVKFEKLFNSLKNVPKENVDVQILSCDLPYVTFVLKSSILILNEFMKSIKGQLNRLSSWPPGLDSTFLVLFQDEYRRARQTSTLDRTKIEGENILEAVTCQSTYSKCKQSFRITFSREILDLHNSRRE